MTTSANPLNQLAQQFLRHLESEAKTLGETHDLVKQVRDGMIHRDTDLLAAAVQQLDQRGEIEQRLARERDRLRNQLLRLLQTRSEEATIGELIRRLDPPLNAQLDEARHRLRSEAASVRRLNQMNYAIAAQMDDVLRRVVEALTGKPISSRYGRSGRMNQSSSNPVFELNY